MGSLVISVTAYFHHEDCDLELTLYSSCKEDNETCPDTKTPTRGLLDIQVPKYQRLPERRQEACFPKKGKIQGHETIYDTKH